MADLLRDLADQLDNQGHDEQHQSTLTPVEVERTDQDEVDSGHYIPPLQQKLELLKKAVNVPSAFDNNDNAPDDLDIIKKNAGINPAVIHIASEDNDITG